MSEFKTIQWGIALVQGNEKDIDIFSDNINQLKAENEKLKQQLKDANEVIDAYNENYDYYAFDLSGSWKDIRKMAAKYLEKYKDKYKYKDDK